MQWAIVDLLPKPQISERKSSTIYVRSSSGQIANVVVILLQKAPFWANMNECVANFQLDRTKNLGCNDGQKRYHPQTKKPSAGGEQRALDAKSSLSGANTL